MFRVFLLNSHRGGLAMLLIMAGSVAITTILGIVIYFGTNDSDSLYH